MAKKILLWLVRATNSSCCSKHAAAAMKM